MKKLEFSVNISASPEKIWTALWQLDNYRYWTEVFFPGSDVKTDNWKEGSEVFFVGPDGTGMYSEVARHIPNQAMTFRHLGELRKWEKVSPAPETEAWFGALESYTLTADGEQAHLAASIEVLAEHEEEFIRAFPEALKRVKELSEA